MITQNELKRIWGATSIDAPNAPTYVKMEVEIQPTSRSEKVHPIGGSLGVVIKV
jgi:hypothetical protein